MKKSVGASLSQAMPDATKDESTKEPDEFETKMHLESLVKAHEIMNDPVKMKAVHKLAGRHHQAIRSIKDLKNHYQEKYGPKGQALASLNGHRPGEESESGGY